MIANFPAQLSMMIKRRTAIFLAPALLALAAPLAALAQSAAPKFPPGLPAEAKQGYFQQFVPAPVHKAFAVSPDGKRYAAVFGHDSAVDAAQAASARCLADFGGPCELWLVNAENLLPAYQAARQQSREALRKLPASLSGGPFADEQADYQVPPPAGLRPGGQMHGQTTLQAPRGARVLSTEGVMKQLRSDGRTVVLDVLHSKSLKRMTLPNTLWIYGAGWEDAQLNEQIRKNLLATMAALVPKKDTPIVTYCSNRDCWLSWNTARRLVDAGYTKVFWYRGGIEAWRAAKLPLVETPLSTSLW